MKKVYESFTDIAEDFKDGSHGTHMYSDHTYEECFPWQHGVMEFAKFLDGCGVKIIANPEIYEELYDNFNHYKPEKYVECSSIKEMP